MFVRKIKQDVRGKRVVFQVTGQDRAKVDQNAERMAVLARRCLNMREMITCFVDTDRLSFVPLTKKSLVVAHDCISMKELVMSRNFDE